jgi:hypothetical protein
MHAFGTGIAPAEDKCPKEPMVVDSSQGQVEPPPSGAMILTGTSSSPGSLFALQSAHLARADEHLRKGFEIVVRQRELVERLKARGQPYAEAKRVLEVMMYAQELMGRHRSMVIGALAWLANHPYDSGDP